MFFCFLSVLPGHNYSCGLYICSTSYRFINYMVKGRPKGLWGVGCLMHMIVLVRYLNEVLFFTGCYSCSLYLFLCLPDRASIFGYWPRVSGTWLRYLHSNLHTAAVLLLRRMAQGKLAFWAGDGGTLPGGLVKVSDLWHIWKSPMTTEVIPEVNSAWSVLWS